MPDFFSKLILFRPFNVYGPKMDPGHVIPDLLSKIKKMNLIGAPYQIIIGKQTEGDLIEFKEVGKETKKLKIAEIIEIIKKQKEKN